jgi:H/ACA ribonucleoprotein complex subunit 2
VKFVRKGEKGFAILAGDTFPIDVYSHLPCVFEDNDIPYVFVPSKHDLGAAIGSKRPTCVLLIKPGEAFMSDFGKTIKVNLKFIL